MADLMMQQCIWPSINTYASLLKECMRRKALTEGMRIHAHILRSGYMPKIFLGNTLVNMYAECGGLNHARKLFDGMPMRNVFSWTIMMGGYVKHGLWEEAIALFGQLQCEGVAKPNEATFVTILKACSSLVALKKVHASVVENGYDSNAYVGSALVDMYAKCGSIDEGRHVFDRMQGHHHNKMFWNAISGQDVVLWNVMIAGYARLGYGKEALALFEKMGHIGLTPDEVTFLGILKACTSLAIEEQSRWVHASIHRHGYECNTLVGSALVDMCAKCGSLKDARRVLNRMCERNSVSWNGLIAGYAQHGQSKEALASLEEMQQEGVMPDVITFLILIKLCGEFVALEHGKKVHASVKKNGLESNALVGGALVDMYMKCRSIKDAREVFDGIREQSVALCSVMIRGYAQNGHAKEAINLLDIIPWEVVKTEEVVFVNILKACARLAALEQGRKAHECLKRNELEQDVIVGSALVDMYAKCGSIEDARQVFDRMCLRDVISWNVMIAGYVRHGNGMEALAIFEKMQDEGVEPNEATFMSTLKACACQAALEKGKHVHALCIMKNDGLELNAFVGSALVDMYAKCGNVENARQAFDKMCKRDVVSWNMMIAACYKHGHGKEAIALFKNMQREHVKPNEVTFLSVLSACGHEGLADEAWQVINSVSQDDHYCITRTMDCMVNVLGRLGHLAEAEDIINKIPIKPSVTTWRALLGACVIHGDVELGGRIFGHTLNSEPYNATTNATLSNIRESWRSEVNRVNQVNDSKVHSFPIVDRTKTLMQQDSNLGYCDSQ